jgi:amino acid transporter
MTAEASINIGSPMTATEASSSLQQDNNIIRGFHDGEEGDGLMRMNNNRLRTLYTTTFSAVSSSSSIMDDAQSQSSSSPDSPPPRQGGLPEQQGSHHEQQQQEQQEQQQQQHRHLGAIPLTVLVFYSVSGGPFGVETSIRSAGNLFTILGFVIMPFVWSLPEALMTAELASTFPEAAGGTVWVEQAFGRRAAWLAGFLGWTAGATDNAIYPVLFLDYLVEAVSSSSPSSSSSSTAGAAASNESEADMVVQDVAMHPLLRFVLLSLTSISLAYINWLGLPVVSQMSLTICFVAMSPFVILCIVGAFQVDPRQWFKLPTAPTTPVNDDATSASDDDFYDIGGGLLSDFTFAGVLWRPFLNNLFWNLNSFDSAGSFAGEVDDPATIFPKVMKWSVFIVAMGYILPLLVALGATPDSVAVQQDWVDGYLARVATNVVGPWLGGWTVLASGISNIALFQAELSGDAFQLMGMADRGYLPNIFTTRSRHGTPTYGLLLGTCVIVVLSVANLDELIEMLNFNYSITLLLEYSAFLKLRLSKPDLHRPYRIPLGTVGCFLFFLPTFAVTLLVLALATYRTLAFSLVTNIVGLAINCQATGGGGGGRFCCQGIKYNAVDVVQVEETELDNMTTTATNSDNVSEHDAVNRNNKATALSMSLPGRNII